VHSICLSADVSSLGKTHLCLVKGMFTLAIWHAKKSTRKMCTCQKVMQIFLQVNWHSTFVFAMAWHAMSYDISSSNITCYKSHVMISHAHMHITFMACICSQHCTMTCPTSISLLPYNSKKLPHVRKTAPYALCSLVVTQSWVRQHYQGIMP